MRKEVRTQKSEYRIPSHPPKLFSHRDTENTESYHTTQKNIFVVTKSYIPNTKSQNLNADLKDFFFCFPIQLFNDSTIQLRFEESISSNKNVFIY